MKHKKKWAIKIEQQMFSINEDVFNFFYINSDLQNIIIGIELAFNILLHTKKEIFFLKKKTALCIFNTFNPHSF